MANNVLMARFKINMDALAGLKVAAMDFPYTSALDDFLGDMIALNPNRKEIKFDEYPPYRRLIDVLVGSAPVLVHGFEAYGSKRRWERSGISAKPRKMLALATDAEGESVWKPGSEQINDLVSTWAEHWALDVFQQEISMRGGEEALARLDERIRTKQPVWDELDASDLWPTRNENHLVWDALPSITSAIFVNRMTDKEFHLGDGENQRAVRWRLTQDGDKHLAVVSEPLYYEHGSKRDLISYKLEFVVQTQARSETPWLAVYIRLRRWADRPITQKNYMRDVSVMITLGSERKAGWHTQPTMVQMRVTGGMNSLRWRDDTPTLLQNWNARPLVDPVELFGNPNHYSRPDEYEDMYHVLHAEGMEYQGRGSSGHQAKSGTSLRERAELIQHIEEVMGETDDGGHVSKQILVADVPMPVDEHGSLARDTIFEQQLSAMYTFTDVERRGPKAVRVPPGSGSKERRRQVLKEAMMTALDRARGNKLLNIMLISKETPTKVFLEAQIRRFLFLEETEPLPDCIGITRVTIPHDLSVSPGKSILEYRKPKEREQFQKLLDAEWRAKTDSWEELLRQHVRKDAHNLAFIEMDGKAANATEKDEWLKRAIRHACVQVGISSQMLFTIPSGIFEDKPFIGDRSRILNAIRDLLLRQLHVLYGPPSKIYHYAGLDEETAQSLVVVGLYRYRSTGSYSIDYPLAVELHPNGEARVVLPDPLGNPKPAIPYVEAGIEIGRLFALPKTGDNWKLTNYAPKQKDARLKHFAESILSQLREQPTLIFMEADGWRSYSVLPIGNEDIEKDHLLLSNTAYAPDQLPNTRLLRIRDAGNLGETPQYAATDNMSWEVLDDINDLDVMVGVPDCNVDSNLTHYFSIGRQLVAAGNQDNELYAFGEGGDVAYKHQQAVEFVPFFLQAGDDPLAYCRIGHFLRSSPAWEGGNIVLPYPVHLGKTLVDDQMDALSPRL